MGRAAGKDDRSAGLTGDSVDNVPGIPGIGPKTAAQLLEEFGDLDTLLARASEIKQQKRRENIVANADLARISRQLVTLRTDVPLELPLDLLVLEPQNGPKLIGFLKAMEFTSLTRRVADACDCDAAAIEASNVKVEWGDTAHGPDLDVGENVDLVAGSVDRSRGRFRSCARRQVSYGIGKRCRAGRTRQGAGSKLCHRANRSL